MLASASKHRRAVARLVVAAGLAPLFTCAASPPVQPSPVVINVQQTAIGINVCHSGCVQNVHVQNISVVVVNQGTGKPVSRPAPKAPPRPAVVSARKVTPRAAPPPPPAQDPPQQTGTPAPDPPATRPAQPGDQEALAPRDMRLRPMKKEASPAGGSAAEPSNPGSAVDARAAAFSRTLPPATMSGPSLPTPWLAVLGVVLTLWISLFFVRRPAPATALLVLDDGPAS